MGNPARSIAALAVCCVLASCGGGDSEKKARGIKFMPEMYDTPAYKSQQAMEALADDGKTRRQLPAMMPPPPGTVSRELAPYDIAPADFAAAKLLVNPLAPSAAVLKQGQRAFATFCAVCHGLDGNAANGYVATSKEHPERLGSVPSLNALNVMRLSDGELYHIITLGRNRMPNYRAQLPPQARWAAIHYLRALDRATLAMSDAEAMLVKLEADAAEGGAHANDPYAKAELEAARAAVVQKKRDLELIKRGGEGAEFEPPTAPQPEYVKPEWPEK
jgi:mono/diheme cytochrome c family protein